MFSDEVHRNPDHEHQTEQQDLLCHENALLKVLKTFTIENKAGRLKFHQSNA